MRVLDTTAELRHQVAAAHARGERVGLVPVTSHLHEGHLALLRTAHAQCGLVICALCPRLPRHDDASATPRHRFVRSDNGDPVELIRRARSLRPTPLDLELAAAAGTHLVWRVPEDAVAPADGGTVIQVGHLPAAASTSLASPIAPIDHDPAAAARASATVTLLLRLAAIAGPDTLYLGERDIRTCVLVERAARDLGRHLDIRRVPVVRDPDGLARG